MGISGWKRTYSLCFMLLILAPVKLLISAPVYPNSHENLSGSEIGEDLEMESETSRRIALAMKTISPGALKANIPFCVRVGNGEPYHKNCIPNPSNPYNRGCSNIYRCRK
nr:protein RALF-like 32 [Ziziphus jujuba var. spinosa]